MEFEEVEQFANENGLDVRIMQSTNNGKNIVHCRLIDENDTYKIDVYFKRDKKKTRIIKNSVFIHKKETWTVARTPADLLKLI